MKIRIRCALIACAALPAAALAQTPPPATAITAEQIRQFYAEHAKDGAIDQPIRILDTGGAHLGIYAVSRPAGSADRAASHVTKVTEIYYILDGGGTLVTGGTLIPPVTSTTSKTSGMVTAHSQAGIDGGVSRHLAKGDIAVIPGNVPHWWKSQDGALTYLIFRADPAGELPLR